MLIRTFIVIFLAIVSSQATASQPLAIAIHGGAGTILKSSMTPELEALYRKQLNDAKQLGFKILADGGTSEQAVISVIKVLEDSSLFNAGVGAVYTYEGAHELDASVMDGKSRMAGAVTGVKTVRHPIELASAVMHKSVHVILSGNGAEQFAESVGIKQIDNSIFNTKRRFDSLQRAKAKMNESANWLKNEDFRYGTVGAVALDKFGNLFAGTSTGGMTAKRWGRIGDSPIIGAGTFADNKSCAVSATGHGEFFIRYNVASDICARVAYQNKSIKQAGDEVIFDVLAPVGGTGGVIIVDAKGNVHMPFNTAGMYRAARTNRGIDEILIYRDE